MASSSTALRFIWTSGFRRAGWCRPPVLIRGSRPAQPALLHAVPVPALPRARVGDVGEAVLVGVLQVLQVQAVRIADVREGVRGDPLALDVGNRAFDAAGGVEQPLRVEPLKAGVL